MLGDHTQKQDVTKTEGGLLAGAQVLTMSGQIAIEDLTPGMRIITRRGVRVLRDVKTSTGMTRAIKISPNTLGFSRPTADLFVVPGQEILVRDWRAKAMFDQDSVVLPIERLIDDVLIYQTDDEEMRTVYSLQFDVAEVFYADGVEVVSSETVSQTAEGDLTLVA